MRPVKPFVSKSARRTYLTTILIVSTSTILLGLATLAYTLFYWSYVPRIGFERTIHLQFDDVFDTSHSGSASQRTAHPYPYGTVNLSPDLIGAQRYDVVIDLTLPRTAENQDAGNFMLEVSMHAQDVSPPTGTIIDPLPVETSSGSSPNPILARSRRPAILPYRSTLVDLLYRLTEIHWYLLHLRTESTTLRVPVFEGVTFSRSRVPTVLRLEIQSPRRLRIYTARARFRARLRGLRWWMYNHRILSALVGVSTFWTTEMLFAGLAWVALNAYLTSRSGSGGVGDQVEVHKKAEDGVEDRRVKIEHHQDDEDDASGPVLSDTERIFPSLSAQSTLRYASPTTAGRIKREPADDMEGIGIPEAVAKAAEADDEDEDDVDFFDSGIGTSLESSAPGKRESVRRRKGRAEHDNGGR